MPRIIYYNDMLVASNNADGMFKRTCPVCGKTFKSTNYYTYQRFKGKERLFYCSYTCYRKQKEYTSITEVIDKERNNNDS